MTPHLYSLHSQIGTFTLHINKCENDHPDLNFDIDSEEYSDTCEPPAYILVFFLLSLFWTSSVIMVCRCSGRFKRDVSALSHNRQLSKNTMQVSVAGVMATWCLDRLEADRCCSPAIIWSFMRSITYSFGSICFGSLLQGIASLLRCLIESARSQRQQDSNNSGSCGGLLLCILDCIVQIGDELLRVFHQWAFIFVALYGYSYVESGKRVMQLFRERGFTAIITDNLVSYVLGVTAMTIGLATAATGCLLEHSISQALSSSDSFGQSHTFEQEPPSSGPPGAMDLPVSTHPSGSPQASLDENDSFLFGPLPHPKIWAASIGFVIGLWVASVMMNVLKGAVNTLIVCWADSPAAMEAQHPELTRELSSTWSGSFNYLNERGPALPGHNSSVIV